MSTHYEVGHVVTFDAANGQRITARVVARVDLLLDGRPGFIGQPVDDPNDRVWGLDIEITDVRNPSPGRPHAD